MTETAAAQAQACPPTVSSHYLSHTVPALTGLLPTATAETKGGQHTQEDGAGGGGRRFKMTESEDLQE